MVNAAGLKTGGGVPAPMKLASDAVTFQAPVHFAGNWNEKLTTPAASVSRFWVSVNDGQVLGGGLTLRVGIALPGPDVGGGQ
jgi:hypothetical protein